MWFVLMVGVATAGSGGEIGVDGEVPKEPSSVRPEYSIFEGAKEVRSASPETLVPVGFTTDKVNWWGRYYDEEGTVYRGSEVVVILKGAGCSRDEIRGYEKNNTIAAVCYISTVVLSPTLVGWVPCYLGGVYFSIQASHDLQDALYEYNKLKSIETSANDTDS